MVEPMSLLVTSLNETTEELLAFIAAWCAIELFVEGIFKQYKTSWFNLIKNDAPDFAKRVSMRFGDFVANKQGLAEKFYIIASVLDAHAAAADDEKFTRLKDVRDNLYHRLEIPASPLPTEDVQKLLLKYMKLHLDSQGKGEVHGVPATT